MIKFAINRKLVCNRNNINIIIKNSLKYAKDALIKYCDLLIDCSNTLIIDNMSL